MIFWNGRQIVSWTDMSLWTSGKVGFRQNSCRNVQWDNLLVISSSSATWAGYDDYYPFGMQMEGRSSVSSADARYKFVGNERDIETGYDHLGDRSYDSRIGRSLSTDPFASKDPSWSPYSYAHNNPIIFCDVNGDSVWVTWQTGFWSFLGLGTEHKALYSGGKLYENGQEYTGDDSYATAALGALNEINLVEGGAGQTILTQIMGSDLNYTLSDVGWLDSQSDRFEPGARGGSIKWDPSVTNFGMDAEGHTTAPAFVALAHEAAHAFDFDIGRHSKGLGKFYDTETPWFYTPQGKMISMADRYACEMENLVRGEHKVTLREYYATEKNITTGKIRGLGPSLFERQ
jgi:RHS repeat-associated protein